MVSFTAREIAPGTHWIGGWVGPRAGLDPLVKRKITSLCRSVYKCFLFRDSLPTMCHMNIFVLIHSQVCDRDSSISIVTRLWGGRPGFISRQRQRDRESLRPDRFWGPPSLCPVSIGGSFPGSKAAGA
jgi:hypothetical protein